MESGMGKGMLKKDMLIFNGIGIDKGIEFESGGFKNDMGTGADKGIDGGIGKSIEGDEEETVMEGCTSLIEVSEDSLDVVEGSEGGCVVSGDEGITGIAVFDVT